LAAEFRALPATILPLRADAMNDSRSLSRRTLLCRAIQLAGSVVALRTPGFGIIGDPNLRRRMELTARGNALRIAVVDIATHTTGSDRGPSTPLFVRGTELGIDEAARAATLLGGVIAPITRANDVREAIALLDREPPLSAMVCVADTDDTAELGAAAASRGVVFMNARASDDVLRNAACARLAFHVAASDAMRAHAIRLWSTQHDSSSESLRVMLWDSRLERFGAAQLNARFESRFHAHMSSDAWAGWFAVKAVWEASQRARAVDGATIAAYLERDTTQFDGQKGVSLSFRRWDHQLRQPLYIDAVAAPGEARKPPAQIPQPDAEPVRAALDALGTSQDASQCRWP
jgi:hypothetical protein